MAIVDLDSIHHFQPPRSAGRPLKGRSEGRATARKRGSSKISNEHNDSAASVPKTKTGAEICEPAGCVDLTTPPPMETGGDPFSEPALSFGGTENVQDSLSIGSHLTAGREENDDPFPSVEALLRDTGEVQEQQRVAMSVDCGSERADGAVKHISPNDGDGGSSSQPKSHGDEREAATDPGSVHPRGDGSVSDGQGEQRGALGPPPTTASDLDTRTVNLHEKTDHPASSPIPPPPSHPTPSSPPPPPPPLSPPHPPPPPAPAQSTDTDLSSVSEKQTEPGGGTFEEIGSSPSSNGKEKTDIHNGHNRDAPKGGLTARGAGGVRAIRASSKRPVDIADLKEKGEGVPRSEKARRLGESAGPIDATDSTDKKPCDLKVARLQTLPEPVFRMPPSWRDFQQRENTASPSRSSETGGSQDNPLVVGDDDEKPNENGGSTRATSVETKLGPTTPPDPPPPEKAETQARSSICTPQPPIETVDRPTSLSVVLPQQLYIGNVGADDRAAVAVANPLSTSPPPLSQPSPAPAPAPEEEEEEEEEVEEEQEWEIRKIVGKRRAGRGYEYRVRWKDTWLPKSELGNARRLLKEFEVRQGAHGSHKRGKRACVDKT